MYISAEARELKVISIGDWGERKLPFQDMVADGMAIWAEENNPDWIFTTGDNFYPKGINSPFDPALNRKWRNVYNHTSLVDLKWYIDLGNHDFGDWNGEEWNQIELTQYEPRWICPHLWYDFVEDLGDATVHFVFIDTESFHWQVERNNYTEMLFWMEGRSEDIHSRLEAGHRTPTCVQCGKLRPCDQQYLQCPGADHGTQQRRRLNMWTMITTCSTSRTSQAREWTTSSVETVGQRQVVIHQNTNRSYVITITWSHCISSSWAGSWPWPSTRTPLISTSTITTPRLVIRTPEPNRSSQRHWNTCETNDKLLWIIIQI